MPHMNDYTAFKQKEFEPILYNLLQDPGVESLLKSSGLDIVSLLVLLVKVYTIVAIVALLLALIASFTMKARIVSAHQVSQLSYNSSSKRDSLPRLTLHFFIGTSVLFLQNLRTFSLKCT